MTDKGSGVRACFTKTSCVAAAGVAGALLILLGSCLGWAYLPGMLDSKVVQRVVLADDSPAFERWRRLPQPLVAKFYLFNVTNPDAVQNGARPQLQELGPYVYDEYIEKVDIEKNEDSGTLSYYLKSTFFFNEKMSGNLSTSDSITILNMPLLGTALKVKRYFPFALRLMDPILTEIFPYSDSIFLSGSAGDLLFGGITVINCSSASSELADMVCDQLDSQMPETVQRVEGNLYKFSFYGYKNGTSKARYTVDRGLKDARQLVQVVAYDGKQSMTAWHEPRCNHVNGTDGIFFPPLLTPADPLVAFTPDICRSVSLKFESKTEYKGVPVLRYVNDPALLGDPETYSDNKCYCVGRSSSMTCLKGGVLDLTPCLGFAVILSYPHLYMADPEYLQYAGGLGPDRRKHESFLEVEPRTGIPLRGSKKVQLNMFLTRIPEVAALRNVSEGLFPGMWMDEGVEVNDKNLVLLHTLNNMVNTCYTARWMAVIVGLALCVAACLGVYSKKKNCGSYDNRVAPLEKQGALNMAFVHDNGKPASPPPDVTKTGVDDFKKSPSFLVDLRRKSSATSPKEETRIPSPTSDTRHATPPAEKKEESLSLSTDLRKKSSAAEEEDTRIPSPTGDTRHATPPPEKKEESRRSSVYQVADSTSNSSSAEGTSSTTSLRSAEEGNLHPPASATGDHAR